MTEEEFRIEARRIAIAFDLPSDCPLKISVNQDVKFAEDISFEVDLEAEDFGIFGCFCEPENKWALMVTDKTHRSLSCYGLPDTPNVSWERSSYPDLVGNLVSALIKLGFDSSPLETRFDLTITAHEKLEWQLEFQRRLREENTSLASSE